LPEPKRLIGELRKAYELDPCVVTQPAYAASQAIVQRVDGGIVTDPWRATGHDLR
jgi:hypothetical protein